MNQSDTEWIRAIQTQTSSTRVLQDN